MPRFATISPTHKPGGKPAAWKHFRDGGYVALGWHHVDYSDYTFPEIVADLKRRKYKNEKEAILAHGYFKALEIGDIVAVNNTFHGLFGVGVIASDYNFAERKHPTGHVDVNEYNSHYREVRWVDVKSRLQVSSSSRGNTLENTRHNGHGRSCSGFITRLSNRSKPT